jgi:hypothetical protein
MLRCARHDVLASSKLLQDLNLTPRTRLAVQKASLLLAAYVHSPLALAAIGPAGRLRQQARRHALRCEPQKAPRRPRQYRARQRPLRLDYYKKGMPTGAEVNAYQQRRHAGPARAHIRRLVAWLGLDVFSSNPQHQAAWRRLRYGFRPRGYLQPTPHPGPSGARCAFPFS